MTGPFDAETTVTLPARGPGDAPKAALLVVHAPDSTVAGARVTVPSRGLVIGREPEGRYALRVADPALSRNHAVVWATAQGLVACEDRGSKNGTFYAGGRVDGCYLRPGAVLRCGGTIFVLGDDASPEDEPQDGARLTGLLGPSAAMARVRRLIASVAPTPTAVLLLGETGTGKDLAAQALHRLSGRAGKLQALNCATVPENLVASTLFGHVKGAFTGADDDRPGLLRAADGGTLFLDEVDELPATAQAALLRVVEDGLVTPVGGTRERRVDVRIVAATARDVFALEREGRFRTDLLARLDDFRIVLPPLRERREDVLPLARAFWAEARGAPPGPLDADVAEALLLSDWRHNVRALRRLVLRLAALHPTAAAPTLAMLPDELAGPVLRRAEGPAADLSAVTPAPSPERIREALRDAGGNVSAVAAALGRDRKQIYRWLKRLGIDPAEYR